MISRPLGEVHSCHPSIIPVFTLFFWGKSMAVAAEIVIIIPPSSKTEGPISKKNIIPSSSKSTENHHPTIIQDSRGPQQEKNNNIGSHYFCAITMFQPSGMMGKSAQSSTPKVDDGLPSSM